MIGVGHSPQVRRHIKRISGSIRAAYRQNLHRLANPGNEPVNANELQAYGGPVPPGLEGLQKYSTAVPQPTRVVEDYISA